MSKKQLFEALIKETIAKHQKTHARRPAFVVEELDIPEFVEAFNGLKEEVISADILPLVLTPQVNLQESTPEMFVAMTLMATSLGQLLGFSPNHILWQAQKDAIKKLSLFSTEEEFMSYASQFAYIEKNAEV